MKYCFLLVFFLVIFVRGESLSFDGSDDYVQVGSHSAYNVSSYTVELWAYLNTSGRNYDPLFFKETGGSSDIELYGGNGLTVLHNRGNAGSCSYFYAPAPVGNAWVHIAISYNSINQNMKLFYNGVEKVSATLPYVSNTANAVLHFGRSYWSSTMSGKMAEMRFWNVARTQSQIQETMDTTLFGNEAGLIGYWRMNEGTGSVVNDLSSNNNDGYIYGATWNGVNPNITVHVPEPSTFLCFALIMALVLRRNLHTRLG